MTDPVYSVISVLDEVRLALNWAGTDEKLQDAEIESFIFENIEAVESEYLFKKVTTGLYKHFHNNPYGLYLWNPVFTGETDCEYRVNARGSIVVTKGTAAADAITVKGTPINFSNCMVQLLHWLATHRAQEISLSVGDGSLSPAQIHRQLIEMADYWTGIIQIA